MIPYIIKMANPTDNMRDENIDTIFGSSVKELLDEVIVNEIQSIMAEYCDISNTSFPEFCDEYWKIKKNTATIIRGWLNVFQIYYFENSEWVEWNIIEKMENK